MTEQTLTILVVDDVEDNRDLMSRKLQRDGGFRVLQAEDGLRALEIVGSEKIDLIVLDVMMPGMTGIEVLAKVRETFSPTELPIVMATAKNQSEDVVEALEHGANDYVTKPFDFAVILARIQTQLRMKQAAAAGSRKRTEDPNDADRVAVLGNIRSGMVLAGKYELESEIGSGNFGAVWRAHHLTFKQPVAIKILQGTHDSDESLARFRQEGQSAFRLQHPNAVTVHDFSVTPSGLAYLVMELLEGHPLDREMKSKPKVTPQRATEILFPLCEVLAEAHTIGIIHRDIKPANVYLHQTRRGEVVKVLDFGIAKLVGDSAMERNLTLDEGILGTPAYMAPERLLAEPYDGRADVYSVGIMLYQMLAAKTPFRTKGSDAMAVAMSHVTQDPDPLSTYRPDLSPAIEAVVMAAIERDPEVRPTMPQLACRWAAALGVEAPEALRPPDHLEAREIFTDLPDFPELSDVVSRARMDHESGSFAFPDLLAPPPGSASLLPVPFFPAAEMSEPWTREPPG